MNNEVGRTRDTILYTKTLVSARLKCSAVGSGHLAVLLIIPQKTAFLHVDAGTYLDVPYLLPPGYESLGRIFNIYKGTAFKAS